MPAARAITMAASSATDRFALWSTVVNTLQLATVVEVGVFAGDFARGMLEACPTIARYYMIDPWRHLDDWNKPANRTDAQFAEIRERALAATAFAADRRTVLRGTTREVANQLPDAGVDLVYIDGDHTLRGITIDLVRLWPKLRPGGIVAGDDFCPSVWQHPARFEPTFVFPWAVHFAEAMNAEVFGLPFDQFAIVKDDAGGFRFHDLTAEGRYVSVSVLEALKAASCAAAPPGGCTT